jgi:hypothetical protein
MVDQAGRAGRPSPPAGQPVPVRFAGPGAGAAPLTWGQRELWRVMDEKQAWLPIGTTLPLPPGTTVAEAVDDLRFVMNSYPSMRTRLRLDPDGPAQVVAGSGETSLEIVDADPDADPGAVADQVWWRYWKGDYDVVTDWPLRMAVVRHRGRLTHRAWVMCHLVTDGAGARVILRELADRDARRSTAARSALELARWQHSPAGQRQSGKVLRRWEQVLRGVPARRFPERTGQPRPRYWQARFDSPATYLAARVVSARTGVESATVLLAMFAVALARVTGTSPVVVQPNVSNRFRPGLADTVSPIMQSGLCVIDVPDTTVDAVVAHTRVRAMIAYKYAYYDPPGRDELVARLSRERGEQVDLGCLFNDRRLRPRDETGPVPTPEQVAGAVPRGSFEWTHRQDEIEFHQLAVSIDDVPDTVRLKVTTDIHRVSPDDVAACVRGIEQVAVAAALDPAARTRPPAG